MDTKPQSDCPYPGCFFCVIKGTNPSKRKSSILKFFRDLPSLDQGGQVLPISGLWNAAMAHPNDPEFVKLGIFECMAALIWKGLKNRRWLSQDQNIYIPYYAAHIIGSYTMNMEEFAEQAVQAGVVPPLVELLRGRLTWVEQRVAVRALGHLATYSGTFSAVAIHGEVLELAIQLASSSLGIVYTHFLQFPEKRLGYHCDLLTRGIGGAEMESRKAEEWASQLQCWSLQLINCFAIKAEFVSDICRPDFLLRLPGMWGGLVNENSSAGVGLLWFICQHRVGRGHVAGCSGVVEGLCNIARSSDDWQYMAVDCLIWLLQDPSTRHKVIDKAIPILVDLSETTSLGDHKRLGDTIITILQDCLQSHLTSRSSLNIRTKEQLNEILKSKQKLKQERNMGKEDLQIKQAAALVVKLEGNSLFSSGDISGAVSKYTEALELCPVKSKKERTVLYSNRAQCFLLLQQPMAAVSDTTRALSLCSRHGKSLWRRAQAYDMLGLIKESLLDAILFINECTKSSDTDHSLRQNKVPDYAEKLVLRQMKAAWLFGEAASKHGGICLSGVVGDSGREVGEESEWETASDSDIGVNEKNAADDDEDDEDDDDDDTGWDDDDGHGEDAYI